jgi:hypothetical protein
MPQMKLRGIDQETKKKIRKKSKKNTPPASSLRRLAGGGSQKEADKFLESIESCEQIDEAMWK